MGKASNPFRFAGFRAPTYTPVPDELFDRVMRHLAQAELLVLLYLMRRTFGFKKDADSISLSQICHGITTKDGRQLDEGTGLARSSAIRAIKGLEAKGLVVAARRPRDGRIPAATTTYRLRFAGEDSEALLAVQRGSSTMQPPWLQRETTPWSHGATTVVAPCDPQQTVEQQTERQQTDPIESIESGDSLEGDDHEHLSAIRWTFVDYSRELGDEEHERSNVSRAINLWHRSGLSRYEFLGLAGEAKKQTRKYQGKQAPGTRIASKGAYFFTILENLVEQRGRRSASRGPPEHDLRAQARMVAVWTRRDAPKHKPAREKYTPWPNRMTRTNPSAQTPPPRPPPRQSTSG